MYWHIFFSLAKDFFNSFCLIVNILCKFIFKEKEQQLEQLEKISDSRNSPSGDCVSVSSWVPLIASSLAKGAFRLISSTPWEIYYKWIGPLTGENALILSEHWKVLKNWQHDNVRYLFCLCFLKLFVEILVKIFCNLCNVWVKYEYYYQVFFLFKQYYIGI